MRRIVAIRLVYVFMVTALVVPLLCCSGAPSSRKSLSENAAENSVALKIYQEGKEPLIHTISNDSLEQGTAIDLEDVTLIIRKRGVEFEVDMDWFGEGKGDQMGNSDPNLYWKTFNRSGYAHVVPLILNTGTPEMVADLLKATPGIVLNGYKPFTTDHQPDFYSRSPLYAAIVNARPPEVVETLLSAGADASITDPAGSTLLHILCSERSGFITLPDINAEIAKQHGTEYSLTEVYRDDKVVGIELFIKEKLRPIPEEYRIDETLRRVDLMQGPDERAEIAALLIESGTDVSAVNNEGETSLHVLLRTDHTAFPLVASLLEAGADPNAVNKSGLTPFWLFLTRHRNALLYSRYYKNGPRENNLYTAVYDLLVSYGADLQYHNITKPNRPLPLRYGQTNAVPVTLAAGFGDEVVLDELIGLGGTIDASFGTGSYGDRKTSPLTEAIKHDQPYELIDYLINRGAGFPPELDDPREEAKQFSYAVEFNQDPEVIRLFLKKGYDPNAKDGYDDNLGWTVFTRSLHNPNAHIPKLLIREGGARLSASTLGEVGFVAAFADVADTELLKMLIDQGGDILTDRRDGENVVYNAALNPYSAAPLQFALNNGGTLDHIVEAGGYYAGQNVLHAAARNINPKLRYDNIARFIELGVSPHHTDTWGWNVLHAASWMPAWHGDTEDVQYILKTLDTVLTEGVDINQTTEKGGYTPLFLCILSMGPSSWKPGTTHLSDREAYVRIRSEKIIEWYLDHGADPGIASDEGTLPADFAAHLPWLRESSLLERLKP